MKTLHLASLLAICGLVACGSNDAAVDPPGVKPVEPAVTTQSGCRLTANTVLTGSGGNVLLRSVTVYDFDVDRRLVAFRDQSFASGDDVGSEPTNIAYTYAPTGLLAKQVVEAGRGQFPDVYRRTATYDAQEFVVQDDTDIGRDGNIDLSMRYTNTYDEQDLRERVVAVQDRRGGSLESYRERDTWAPDEGRKIWTHVNRLPTGGIRVSERYGIVDGKIAWREVDMGGDGTVDFRDEPQSTNPNVKVENDALGRPIVVHYPGEISRTSYEDTCGGIVPPAVQVDPKFRSPGIPKK